MILNILLSKVYGNGISYVFETEDKKLRIVSETIEDLVHQFTSLESNKYLKEKNAKGIIFLDSLEIEHNTAFGVILSQDPEGKIRYDSVYITKLTDEEKGKLCSLLSII